MMANTHMGESLGDSMFHSLGISPWTKSNDSGVHWPVVFGLLLMLTGVIGAIRFLRPRYPKILSRIIIGCIAFVCLFPIVTEKAMFFLQRNATGVNSLDYNPNKSTCQIQTLESTIKANCSFALMNYGDQQEFTIRPLMRMPAPGIRFEPKKLNIPPHSRLSVGMDFESPRKGEISFSGTELEIGIEIEVDGVKRRL
jgi:hypothetical protein